MHPSTTHSYGRDPEWDAAHYLLSTPLIESGTAPFIDAEQLDIDWPQLRRESRAWSSGERLLVQAAWDLWSGEHKGTSLFAYTAALDTDNFERLIAALRIRRGAA